MIGSNLKNYFCLDQSQELGLLGGYGTYPLEYISLAFNYCDNKTSPIPCKPIDAIKYELRQAYIYLFFPDFYFDHKNSSEVGQFYQNSIYLPMNMQTYRRNYLYYKRVEYFTDVGYVFEDFKSKDYFTFSHFDKDLYIGQGTGPFYNTFGEITFTMPFTKDVYYRNYKKIQDLLADIGGFMKACLLIVVFTSRLFSKNLQAIEIFDSHFTDDNIEKTFKIATEKKIKFQNFINQRKEEEKINMTTASKINFQTNSNIKSSSNANEFQGNNLKKDEMQRQEKLQIQEKQRDVEKNKIRISFWNLVWFCGQTKVQKVKLKYAKMLMLEMFDYSNITIKLREIEEIKLTLEKMGRIIKLPNLSDPTMMKTFIYPE